MNIVYKYPVLSDAEGFELELSKNADIIHVAEQYAREVYMWVIQDISAGIQKEKRRFLVVPTGKILDNQITLKNHLGTFFMNNNTLVFHLFEIE